MPEPESASTSTSRASSSKSSSLVTKSRIDSLLDAVDLDNVTQMDLTSLTVDGVPGGTLSFLFEKSTKVENEEAADEGGDLNMEGIIEDEEEGAPNSMDEGEDAED